MLKINKHKFNTQKNKQIKIMFLSDIHYSKEFNIELQNNIITNIKKINPNYICITGDLLDNAQVLDNNDQTMKFLIFLKSLSKITNVFIVFGNHDLENVKNPSNNFDKYIKKWKELLKGLKNVYLLDNEKYSDDNVNIIGINLPPSYYHDYPNENVDIVIKEINKQNYTLDNKYNILLIHSPRRILTKKAINNIDILKNIDLILSGHMHDGVVPKFLKKFPTSIGFISPHKKLFPKYARGLTKKKIDNNICNLLVTGGVTKISPALPWYFQKLKCLYNNEIEYIEISGNNEK